MHNPIFFLWKCQFLAKNLWKKNSCAIIELSERYEQAQLKPTIITIREPGTVIGVEYLIYINALLRILMMTYEHPPAQTVQVLSLPTTYLNSDFFCCLLKASVLEYAL